ncbi:MAG: hypothetical protein RLZZ528_2615 [Pseudomonadota bacterium]|jgi:hypothetical protein
MPVRKALIRSVLTALVLGTGGTVFAASFQVPQGCTAYATVQLRNCQVSQHYTCTGDPAGEQWAVYIDGEGAHFASKIDSETRWIESVDLIGGVTDRIDSEADPASFSNLLRAGRDDFDFTTTSSDGETVRYRGFDQLTGEKATIDGVLLSRTRFELTAESPDGSFLWRRAGQQFVSEDWRIFFSDRESFENSFGDKVDSIDSPVEFAFPGDKGFLSADPKYDCDVVTAQLHPDTARLPAGLLLKEIAR